VEPNKDPKTDKLTVLSEAIRTVRQLQVENHQLKQLNKFLEEKASSLERERAQSMFFQMQGGMMQQPVMGAGMAPIGGMMMQQPAGMMMGPAAMQPQGMQCMMQPAGMMAAAHPQQAADLARQTSGAIMQQQDPQQQQDMRLEQQQQLPQQPDPQQHHQQQPLMQAHGSMGGDMKVGVQGGMGMPGMGQPGAPGGGYWQSMVPHNMLDANQDSLLRPPAA